jgi:hypothetical protein
VRRRNAETFLSRADAHKWRLEGEVEVFSNPFDDPSEAASEAETTYMKIPAVRKRRVEETVRGNKVSGSAWAMRCVEQCLADEDPSEAHAAAGQGW